MEEISREAFEYLIRTRRYLHENPEPAPYEDETCRFIGNELARFGIPYEVVENGGIIARILGSQLWKKAKIICQGRRQYVLCGRERRICAAMMRIRLCF